MKTIKYRMTFRSSLSDFQEKTLIGHIQSMQNAVIESLRKSQKNMKGNLVLDVLKRTANPVALSVLKDRIDYLLIEKDGHPLVWSYYTLEKEADGVYVFSAPEKDELLGSKQMLSMLPNVITKFLAEDQTLKFLRETVRDMKVEDGEYKITTSNLD